MAEKNAKAKVQNFDALFRVVGFIGDLFLELFKGIKKGYFPWHYVSGVAVIFSVLFVTRLDAYVWKFFRVQKLYPFHPFFYWIYVGFFLSSAIWGWAFIRVLLRYRLVRNLTSAFRNAGLQTRMGRLPGFISDEEMDSHLRKLVVSSVGLPKSEFEKAKSYLASELQVHIDEIKCRVERGTAEILYAHSPLEEKITFEKDEIKQPLKFKVGQTRSGPLYVSLREVPHILVGGYTNSGKSTFLRQMLSTLAMNSPGLEFTLIDLKRGLEFQVFESLPGARIYIDSAGAIEALQYVEAQLEKRMLLLKANKANDLDAYFKIEEKKRITHSEWKGKKITRHIVVIDEAAELFLASATLAGKEAQIARRLASKIAALGRAVGIHLVIATQRPDRNAVDPLIKTNLQGRLCFQMADNASSMTILDSVRAADLPPIRGRAIWRSGYDLTEVQVPLLERDELEQILFKEKVKISKVEKGIDSDSATSSNLPSEEIPKDEIAIHDQAIDAPSENKKGV